MTTLADRGRNVRSWLGLVAAAVLSVILMGFSSTSERMPPPIAPPARYVQVIAHPDDDIIFMNPDLVAGIRSGQSTTGIYLTAGETDKPDAAAYAARRQAGTRAAYARMAGVANDWRAERLDVDPRHAVELYTLHQRPQVQLVFVDLPENNDPLAVGGRGSFVRLWKDDRDELRVGTLLPAGGVLERQYFYTHSDVVQLLVRLFERFRPTVVRAQDPNPDKRLLKDNVLFHDHPDHVAAARFTDAASLLYQGPRFIHENYRDYNVAEVPPNLSAADRQDKIDIFGAYVPHDSDVSLGYPYNGWLPAMYQRYPRGSTWASDGRAYLVLNGQLYACRPGEAWTALPWADGPLNQAVSAAGGWVVAKRAGDNQILALVDGTWRSLGNPNDYVAGDRAQIGSPVTNGKAVYVKNGRGGLSVWRSGRGWTDIGGTDIQDGVALAGDDVYASTRDKVLRWHADRLDAGFASLRPAGPPSAAVVSGGITVAYRTDTGQIALGDKVLPGFSGPGNPTVTTAGTVFARTSAGGLAVNTGTGWRDLGGQILDQPAPMGTDVVALSPDGQVRTFQGQSPPRP
jgi:LmbE family N-acetylglucosaminyl deacetylase